MDDATGVALTGSAKPRLLLLCDRRGWAYDITARNLASRLGAEFDFDIRYVAESPVIDPAAYDLIYVFWWGERYHRRFVPDGSRTVKEVSSHRWELEEAFGRHSPAEAVERYMHDAAWLVTTSRLLERRFREVHPGVFRYPLGVDTGLFGHRRERTGPMRIGWAGNIGDRQKGVGEILVPACGSAFELSLAPGDLPHESLGDFFNGLDVICVASAGEGTPLPLIEAMACGCFAVSTDVGVAREVIEHGRNGLIVARSPEAFREAFEWCGERLDLIRGAGRENAERIRSSQSWEESARQYAEVIRRILSDVRGRDRGPRDPGGSAGYEKHFLRVNPGGDSDAAYASATAYYREDIEPLLPAERDGRVLEAGTGHGHLLRYLVDRGYTRVTGIDACGPLLDSVRRRMGHAVERLEVADAADYLARCEGAYACILVVDMIEHLDEAAALSLLRKARRALAPGGRVIVRTPNMANVLGGYSRHMDLTHRHGYTEFSLMQLFEEAGFASDALHVHVPAAFATPSRRRKARVNAYLHRLLFRLNDRVAPRWFGKNVVVWAEKGER